jgi:hypothetical protein
MTSKTKSSMGGEKSYVELLTCLEMSTATIQIDEPHRGFSRITSSAGQLLARIEKNRSAHGRGAKKDVVYPLAFVDAEGRPLNGRTSLHSKKGSRRRRMPCGWSP